MNWFIALSFLLPFTLIAILAAKRMEEIARRELNSP